MSRRLPGWAAALERAVGDEVVEIHPVRGGDIGDSHRVVLASGDPLFCKHYADAPPGRGVAVAEAEGLRWLGEVDALRVARPLAWAEDWIALEWIERAAPSADFDHQLGRGLARLHATTPDSFGLDSDNWIGLLPQVNQPTPDWPTFYGERRLRPLQGRARDTGRLPHSLSQELDRLIEGLPERTGPPEPPARLHGDLWAGNVMADESGLPCLIDPAAYGGHREVDLAMMRLFGGFGRDVFEAYQEAHPLERGWEQRVPLYQVYPLLVHVCLFGDQYLPELSRAISDAMD